MPRSSRRRNARDEFRHLLDSRASESQWQAFLAANPFIFSDALPLPLEESEIRPRGRPGRSEADFIFYTDGPSVPLVYGVIEIKRPVTPIVSHVREDTVILSRAADTARAQAVNYLDQLDHELRDRPNRMLTIGGDRYAFLIVGLSEEITRKLTAEAARSLEAVMPPGFQLIPYDTLLAMYEAAVPMTVFVAVRESMGKRADAGVSQAMEDTASLDRELAILAEILAKLSRGASAVSVELEAIAGTEQVAETYRVLSRWLQRER